MSRNNINIQTVKIEPRHKGLAIGIGVVFFAGLIIFGGMWAFVIAAVCLLVGTALGLIVGAELGRRDGATERAALEDRYDAASELAYKLNEELHAVAQRAESAERDLLAVTAEKTSLRAQLDQQQADSVT